MTDDEYRVGPGRPPRDKQFKKGQSGNPGGRRTGSRNVRTVLREELEAEIRMAGSAQTIPVLRALVKMLIQKGLKGDLRAIESLLDRVERHAEPDGAGREEHADEDEAILRRILGRDAA